ncbi:MAG: hypothetical protein JWP01_495 [Myxococcales bacterium]|nr:hypothetical protein [Myxococcales bacterium]
MWCETLSFDELMQPSVVGLLARFHVDLLLAVRPWQLAEVGDAVRGLRDAGVFVAVWPMLADVDGRWASASSALAYGAFTDELLAQVGFADELAIDLEPPLHDLARWKSGRPTWRQTPAPHTYRTARDSLVGTVERWRAEHRVTTAVLPLLALEWRGQWMQRALGTPATELAVDRHSVMAYTSLYEGWSRGLVNRSRAERLLGLTARLTRSRFGAKAAISLGTVGPGAFGDEPGYRDPSELRRDVQLVRAAGIDEIALFDLGGVIRRAPAEAWLESLCAPA